MLVLKVFSQRRKSFSRQKTQTTVRELFPILTNHPKVQKNAISVHPANSEHRHSLRTFCSSMWNECYTNEHQWYDCQRAMILDKHELFGHKPFQRSGISKPNSRDIRGRYDCQRSLVIQIAAKSLEKHEFSGHNFFRGLRHPGQIPGISRWQSLCIPWLSRERAFWPSPLRMEDPHPLDGFPSNESLCSFFSAWWMTSTQAEHWWSLLTTSHLLQPLCCNGWALWSPSADANWFVPGQARHISSAYPCLGVKNPHDHFSAN